MINNLDHVVVTYSDNIKTAGIVDQYVPGVYLELVDLFGHRKHIPSAVIKTIDIVNGHQHEFDEDDDDDDDDGGDSDDEDPEGPPHFRAAIFFMDDDDIA